MTDVQWDNHGVETDSVVSVGFKQQTADKPLEQTINLLVVSKR